MATFLANLTSGADSILGTSGDDIIQVPPSSTNLSALDTIAGGLGFDTLLFLRTTDLAVGPTLLPGVTGIEEFDVTLAPFVQVILNDANILQSDTDRIRLTFDADPLALDLRLVSATISEGVEIAGTGTVTLYDAARQSLRIADGVNGRVIGGLGRDSIAGGTGADSLSGGFGDDVLRGNGGADTLSGDADQDWLYGGTGNDVLQGGAGFDLLTGGSGTNTLTGGTEADTFVISAGEVVTITDFNPADPYERIDLRAFAGLNFAGLVISETVGNAQISLPSGSVVTLTGVAAATLRPEMFIFAGDPVVTLAQGLGVVPYFEFTANTDVVTGTAGSDVFEIKGIFTKLTSTDSFNGGAGVDILRVWGADRALSPVNLGGMQSVEVLDLTGSTGALGVTLTAALVAQSGNGTVTLRHGANAMIVDTETAGGPGAVVIEGTGEVTLRNVAGQSVTVSNLIAGRIQGGSQADEVQGGALNDTLTGNDGHDSLWGGAGNDSITGGAGDDWLTGQTGVNTLTGGLGTDHYVIAAGETTTITDFDLADHFEVIDLSAFAGLTHAALVMVDRPEGVEISLPDSSKIIVLGRSRAQMDAGQFFFDSTLPSLDFQLTAGADSFTGGAGDDLFDVTGNIAQLDQTLDHLNGGAGTDTLRIFGADRVLNVSQLGAMQSVEVIDLTMATGNHAITLTNALVAQSGNGAVRLRLGSAALMLDTETAGGTGAVVVEGTGTVTLRNVAGQSVSLSDLVNGRILGGSQADEVQGGAGHDTLTGNDGHDSLWGGAGNDSITGGAGDDWLTGQTGVNTLTGGLGTDHYVIAAGETTTITDFDLADHFERIDLSAFAGLTHAALVMVDGPTGVEISLPDASKIIVLGRSRAQMDAGQFVFDSTLPSQAFLLTAGADSFTGGAGDDLFDVTGNIAQLDQTMDHINGGAGTDTLRVFGANRVLSPPRLDAMQSIEVIDLTMATGNHAVTLANAYVTGTESGVITLRHGAGNLLLDAAPVLSPLGVQVEGTGSVTLRGTTGQHVVVTDRLAGHVFGGDEGDRIAGGAQDDVLDGMAGEDSLWDGAGDDTLSGGDGNDLLVSSQGDDQLAGGTGGDSFVILTEAGTTTLQDFRAVSLMERIDLRDFAGLTGFDNLVLTDAADGLHISAPDLDLVLQGVTAAEMGASDFLFAGQDPLVFQVPAGTPMAQLQLLLDNAPPGSVIQLEAGVYSVTETLRISRSDISLIGAGEGQTIFRTDIPDASAAETILVQPDTVFRPIGALAANAAEGSTTVTLTAGHGLSVGDILYVSQANDADWLAATGNTGWTDPATGPDDAALSYLREMHSRIVAINGNTVTLAEPLPYSFAAGVAQYGESPFLSNVHLADFTIEGRWGTPDPFLFEEILPDWTSIAALELDAVRDSTLDNISVLNSAAHAFKLQRNYDVTGTDLTAIGTHDKGPSSGYLFYLNETFSSRYTGLVALDGRHAVLFSSFSAEHGNVIEVLETNRDINFHGSPDSGNTVVVRDMHQDYPEGSSPQWKAVSPGSFPEHPQSTIEDNTITFVRAVTGEDHDTVIAAPGGAFLSTNAGRDTLVGGAGADTLDGGTDTDTLSGGGGRDRFIRQYADESDVILDFATGAAGDILVIKGSAYGRFSDLVLRQVGADVVLDFGTGGTTTFANTLLANLTEANFLFQSDIEPGQTLTPRADQMLLVATDKADTIVATRSHITTPGFTVFGGAGFDTLRINTASLAGSLSDMGTFWKIDAVDVSTIALVGISIGNQMAARSDSGAFTLRVGDDTTLAAVQLTIGSLAAGKSVWLDGARAVQLTGTTVQKVRFTDRAAADITGSGVVDKIQGGAQDDRIDGGAGDDMLYGSAGNDTLTGGTGADTMTGGQGSDLFYVDNALDRIIEDSAWTGTDTVIASVNYTLGSGVVEVLTLTGSALVGIGNKRKNTVNGNDLGNTLDGGAGNDTLAGGQGNDTYVVQDSGDVLIEEAGAGTDLVRAYVSVTLADNIENVTLQDVRDTLGNPVQGLRATGNALDNTLTGNAFDNVLAGGLGNDSLRGRAGADSFVFDSAPGAENLDHIVDFTKAEDRIHLAGSVFGLPTGALAATAFQAGSTALDADDRILYDKASGSLYLDLDGDGAGAAVLFAILDNTPNLSETDFLII